MHPLPSIPSLELDGPLAGVPLVCPWVTFSVSAPAFTENLAKVIHGVAVLHDWERDCLSSPSDKNAYSEPFLADVSWWKDAPVKKLLMNWGDYELFRDDREAFSRRLEDAGQDVTAVRYPREVHIDCIFDAMMGTEYGLMSTSIWDWLDTVF